MADFWPTRIVVVVASLSGRPATQRGQRSLAAQHNTSSFTFVVYQRLDPTAPNYSPNHAHEAGVYIQFILEHYDHLPQQTLFAQDMYADHNPELLGWAACTKPDAAYSPMTAVRLLRRGLIEWKLASNLTKVSMPGLEAIVEQCWRNFLDVFGKSRLLPPQVTPTVGYYQGALFLASRDRLRAFPRSTYARAHKLAAGGDGRCHHGELEWARLSFEKTDYPEDLHDSPRLSKHTSAGAWEHLQHVIVGSMGMRAPFYFDWCSVFEYSGHCMGSPCHKLRRHKNRTASAPRQSIPSTRLPAPTLPRRMRLSRWSHRGNVSIVQSGADV